MSAPLNKVRNDGLRRFVLACARIRRMEPIPGQPENPLDDHITEHRNAPLEDESKVGRLVDEFEARMCWQKRWDGFRWEAPVYKEFGAISDVELKKNGEWKSESEGEGEEVSTESAESDDDKK